MRTGEVDAEKNKGIAEYVHGFLAERTSGIAYAELLGKLLQHEFEILAPFLWRRNMTEKGSKEIENKIYKFLFILRFLPEGIW